MQPRTRRFRADSMRRQARELQDARCKRSISLMGILGVSSECLTERHGEVCHCRGRQHTCRVVADLSVVFGVMKCDWPQHTSRSRAWLDMPAGCAAGGVDLSMHDTVNGSSTMVEPSRCGVNLVQRGSDCAKHWEQEA